MRNKIIILFIAVHLPLVLGIYLGTVLPGYIEAQKVKQQHANFFLNNKEIIKLPKQMEQRELIIARKYKVLIIEVEDNYYEGVSELARSAYQEYQALKAKDPNYSPYSLASKYLPRLRLLEENCDRDFTRYIAQMEKELQVNSLPLDLIKQARYAYQRKKQDIKREFYNRGQKFQ
ncbi:hypothetical protein [Desulfoscipio gibsoniae]|uniref:Uncharacterized protein n=1 Tax=Desulfoscipio gibsoniae DSM 7213 TaxID=767817 RepID=R4KN59_9FIRM|nr:hypothetical protein [Desulfoscipio gibsoniae]AGL01046.1 hypothetical protein Desgi_1564 [Desulfoscipio gibsoniae DSM 7213]